MNKCSCCDYELSCEFYHDCESDCCYSPITSICKCCKDIFEVDNINDRNFCSAICRTKYEKDLKREILKLEKKIGYSKFLKKDIDNLDYLCLLLEESFEYKV